MRSIDLNLLVALDVLLTEGSVTLAAQRLIVGVPVMSRTLSRIRDLFGDPILVRAGRNLTLTSRALEIRGHVHTVVQGAQDLLRSSSGVTLAQLERTFTIRASDSVYGTIEAKILELIALAAPRITLRFCRKVKKMLAHCGPEQWILISASPARLALKSESRLLFLS